MEPVGLSTTLKRFYVEAVNVEVQPYSRSTMEAIRSGLDRFLSGSPQRRPFSIIRGKVFKPTNEALDASLKDLERQRLISFTNQKWPISGEDHGALYAASQLGLNTPESLVNTTWFYTILYFEKRGSKNQLVMKPGDLQLKTTTTSGWSPLSCGLPWEVLGKKSSTMWWLLAETENHNVSSFHSGDKVCFCSVPIGSTSWRISCQKWVKQLVLHIFSSLHSSYVGNCPQSCRLRKLPSKERNRPCKW